MPTHHTRTWYNEVHHDVLAPGQAPRSAELRAAIGSRRGSRRGLGTLPVRVSCEGCWQWQKDVLREAQAATPALLQLQLQKEAAAPRRVPALLHIHYAKKRKAPTRRVGLAQGWALRDAATKDGDFRGTSHPNPALEFPERR